MQLLHSLQYITGKRFIHHGTFIWGLLSFFHLSTYCTLKVVILQMHMIKKYNSSTFSTSCRWRDIYKMSALLWRHHLPPKEITWFYEPKNPNNPDLIFCESDVVSSWIFIHFLQNCRNGKMLDVSVGLQCYCLIFTIQSAPPTLKRLQYYSSVKVYNNAKIAHQNNSEAAFTDIRDNSILW